MQDDIKIRGKKLVDEFGWDKDLTKKIWCFGPDTMGPNLMIDATKAVQYLSEIKDSVVAAFQWASKEGPMSEENMRGSAFEVWLPPVFGWAGWRNLMLPALF